MHHDPLQTYTTRSIRGKAQTYVANVALTSTSKYDMLQAILGNGLQRDGLEEILDGLALEVTLEIADLLAIAAGLSPWTVPKRLPFASVVNSQFMKLTLEDRSFLPFAFNFITRHLFQPLPSK